MNRANRTDRQTRTDRPNRTDPQTATDRQSDDSSPTKMGEVSHTHPHTARGAINRPFQRGPVVAADGGEREAYEGEEPEAAADAREEDDERDSDQMKDVNHTPPHGEGANPVFERGGREEPVESEE